MLQVALNLAKKAMDLLKAASARPVAQAPELAFDVQEARPHNALRQVQRRFQRKRRKVVRSKTPHSKPTTGDISSIKNAWDNAEVQFCTKCLVSEDSYGRRIIDWMFCEQCSAWLHLACCPVNDESSTLHCPHCNGEVTEDEDDGQVQD